MLWTAALWPGQAPIAVRYPRAPIPDESLPEREPRVLEIGRAEQLRAGGDIALIALGTMVLPALAAAEKLAEQGVSATVVNARFAAPLDERMIAGLARSIGRLVTIEEAVVSGGFGSAVSECLDRLGLSGTLQLRLALPAEFIAHGKRDELLEQAGLDASGIARRVKEWHTTQVRQFT